MFHKMTAPVWELCLGGIGEVVVAMTMLTKSNKVKGGTRSAIQMFISVTFIMSYIKKTTNIHFNFCMNQLLFLHPYHYTTIRNSP